MSATEEKLIKIMESNEDENVDQSTKKESNNEEGQSSYGQIFRSSTILGGAQALTYLILVVRSKAIALLLGPTGLGTINLFQSIVTLISTVSTLGIATSGVREIAEAERKEDHEGSNRVVHSVLRVSWLTGLLGWLLMAAFAYPLSLYTFQKSDKALAIAILGSSLVFSSVTGGYCAILQGRRQLGKLATYQVASSLASVLLAVALFCVLGESGIVPSIIVAAIASWALYTYQFRREVTSNRKIPWNVTSNVARRLISLGIAFVWNALLASGTALIMRVMIVKSSGLEANGIYQASWALSGILANFVLSAMGTDFFPRLSAVANEPIEINRLVNEQTEIGILLATPGLILTLALTPLLMTIFYSARFAEGAELLPWFVLGVFGQVISWPMGYIQVAQGASRPFMITQTLFNAIYFGVFIILLSSFGLKGAAISFSLTYALYTFGMLFYNYKRTKFIWNNRVIRLVAGSCILVGITFLLTLFVSGIAAQIAGVLISLITGYLASNELLKCLPKNHKLVKILQKILIHRNWHNDRSIQ